MTVTLADFQQRVGQRLGIVRAAEPLSVEDAELIYSAYASLWAELEDASLVDWAVNGPIPERVAEIVIGMTAARLVDEFGLDEPRRSQMILQQAFGLSQASEYERRLRRIAANPYDGETLVAEYY